MAINIALLEKLAQNERKTQKPENKWNTAAGLLGTNFVANSASSITSQLLMPPANITATVLSKSLTPGLLGATILGNSVGNLATLGIMGNSVLTKDHKKRDERNKKLAIAGSLGYGATLASVLEGARRGAKVLQGTRNKLKAFGSVPAAAIIAATPYALYRVNKHLNPTKGSSNQ